MEAPPSSIIILHWRIDAVTRVWEVKANRNGPALENVSYGDPSKQNLEFITIEGDPCKAANSETVRKLVRTNARRSVHRGKNADAVDFPLITPAPDPAGCASSQIPGRTRFALSSRKPMKRVRRRAPVGPPANELRDESLQVIPRSLPFLETSSNWVPPKAKPNIGRMLQHLFNQLVDTRHNLRESEIENFEVLATVDQGLFHAGLAIASVYYDTGTSDLYHSQQTLKIVSRRLSDYYMQSSDETISAVGLLLIHDTLIGAAANSSLHMNGLEQMVDARGGLHNLPTRLRRTLSMIDTFYATTWNCHPRFPFIQPPKDLSSTLNSFPLLTNFDLKLLNLRTQVGIYLEAKDILQVLRVLTGVRFADPISVFNRLALSDAIYILEWQLLPTKDPLSALYHASLGPESPEAFRLAAFLYIDMVLREMHSANIVTLVRRLMKALQEDSSGAWQGRNGTKYDDGILLWILFVGRMASTGQEEEQYFTKGLEYICRIRHFQSLMGMEEAIDNVGPGLQTFSKQCAAIWDEISLLRKGESSHVPLP